MARLVEVSDHEHQEVDQQLGRLVAQFRVGGNYFTEVLVGLKPIKQFLGNADLAEASGVLGTRVDLEFIHEVL